MLNRLTGYFLEMMMLNRLTSELYKCFSSYLFIMLNRLTNNVLKPLSVILVNTYKGEWFYPKMLDKTQKDFQNRWK